MQFVPAFLTFCALCLSKGISPGAQFKLNFEDFSTDKRPVYYYGYINNEHYSHWMPPPPGWTSITTNASGEASNAAYSTSGFLDVGSVILCPTGTAMTIKQAFYGLLDVLEDGTVKENGNCTLPNVVHSIKAQCDGRQNCYVPPRLLLRSVADDPCPDIPKKLYVKKSCDNIEMPPPLYDRTTQRFREGISHQYLMLPDHSASCRQLESGGSNHGEYNKAIGSLQAAKRRCAETHCSYLIYQYFQRSALLCFNGFDWQVARKQPGTLVAVNPETLRLPGYAVYTNAMGICPSNSFERISQSLAHLPTIAAACIHHKCNFFTCNGVMAPPSAVGFEDSAWLCRADVIIVPREGWITAVRKSFGGGDR